MTVTDSTPPTAVTQPNITVDAGTVVTFNATNSTDDERITSYEWDWTGDGSYEESGVTASYNYTGPGTYNATLRVTDGENNTDIAQRFVTVQAVHESDGNNSSDTGGSGGGSGDDSATMDGDDVETTTTTSPTTATSPPARTTTATTNDSTTTTPEGITGGSGQLLPALVALAIVVALLGSRWHRQ